MFRNADSSRSNQSAASFTKRLISEVDAPDGRHWVVRDFSWLETLMFFL
jgi:hypothetical protein